MANKHSRQGLALGVSLALGATTLGVLPAQAVDYENLSLTIAEDDTNGVLATTMTNDFELELEWDVANVSDLAYLKYEVTVDSSEDGDSDVYGVVSGLSWDSAEDDIIDSYPFDVFEDEDAEDGNDYIIAAPAHVIGDDEVVDYQWTVSVAGGANVCSSIVTGDSNSAPTDGSWTMSRTGGVTFGTVPAAFSGCGIGWPGEDQSVTYNYDYEFAGGFSGSVDEPAPVDFESLIWLSVGSNDTYVDLVVEAWLDKDGDDVKDATESYAAPVTIRFWNDYELTPALSIEQPVWVSAIGDSANAQVTTYITQELNEYYTDDLSSVNEDFHVYSDLNYGATRDGYVYLPGTYDGEDVDSFGFGEEFSGKHLYDFDLVSVDSGEVSRIGVADYTSSEYDDYFAGIPNNVNEIVAGPVRIEFDLITVDYVEGLLVEQAMAWRGSEWLSITDEDNWYSGDGFIHESVENVDYTITLYSYGEDEDIPVAGVETVLYGYTATSEDYGVVTVNGVTVPMTGEDAGYFELEATSNAAGQIVLDINVENPDADFYVELDVMEYQGVGTENIDNWDGDNAYLDWQASEWTIFDELDHDEYQHVGVGESATLTYFVRDQWRTAPAANTARMDLMFFGEDFLGGSRDYEGRFGPTNLVNGSVSFTVPDVNPAAGEGSVGVLAVLDMKDENGGWTLSSVDTNSLTLDYLDDAAVATIDQDQDADADDITYADFINVDAELTRFTKAMDDDLTAIYDEDNDGYFYGYVRNADGHGLAGQKITFSGSGLQFLNGEDNYATDSLTLFTDADGYYYVYVYGHVVGEHTITISSGGKSATATFEVTNGNVRAHDVAITSPFAAKAGTADTLTALVTDRYGNVAPGKAVTFSKVSGSGYIEAPATSNTDEDGVASATLVVLGGEVGFNSTVRAVIEQETFAAASNSEAAQRSAGDTNVGKTTAWTKLQDDGTAKMYAKNIVGVGKVQFFHNGREIAWVRAADALNPKLRAANGAFYLVRTVELVDGKNVLEVYIDGERVRRTAYTQR